MNKYLFFSFALLGAKMHASTEYDKLNRVLCKKSANYNPKIWVVDYRSRSMAKTLVYAKNKNQFVIEAAIGTSIYIRANDVFAGGQLKISIGSLSLSQKEKKPLFEQIPSPADIEMGILPFSGKELQKLVEKNFRLPFILQHLGFPLLQEQKTDAVEEQKENIVYIPLLSPMDIYDCLKDACDCITVDVALIILRFAAPVNIVFGENGKRMKFCDELGPNSTIRFFRESPVHGKRETPWYSKKKEKTEINCRIIAQQKKSAIPKKEEATRKKNRKQKQEEQKNESLRPHFDSTSAPSSHIRNYVYIEEQKEEIVYIPLLSPSDIYYDISTHGYAMEAVKKKEYLRNICTIL